MLTTAKARNRYPFALAIVAAGAYLQQVVPHWEIIYTVSYLLAAGIFAWEILLGVGVALSIFAAFKVLAMLPLGLSVVIIFVLALFFGV